MQRTSIDVVYRDTVGQWDHGRHCGGCCPSEDVHFDAFARQLQRGLRDIDIEPTGISDTWLIQWRGVDAEHSDSAQCGARSRAHGCHGIPQARASLGLPGTRVGMNAGQTANECPAK